MHTVRRTPVMRASMLLGCVAAAVLCAAPARGADGIRIYDAAELDPGRYRVVQRLWVESWSSAFDVPRHAHADAAVARLKSAAAQAGADGLVNVACVPDAGALWQRSGVFCHALAIRLAN